MSRLSRFPWLRIVIWGLVLGVAASVVRDWGSWAQFPLNALWRVLITMAGGLAGWLLNVFAGGYVGMGTNVIESMGVFKFSGEAPKKIENGFIFVMAVVGALLAFLVIG